MSSERDIIPPIILGACIQHPSLLDALTKHLTPQDMTPGPAAMFTMLIDLATEGVRWDEQRVQAEWARRGFARTFGTTAVFTCLQQACLPGQVGHYVAALASANAKLRLQGIAEGLLSRADSPQTPEEIAAWASSQMEHVLDQLVEPPAPELTTATQVRSWSRPDDSWIIEDLIAEEERVIITAQEGLGKSTILSQIAVAAAAGVNPFSGHKGRTGPVRSLHVDLENPATLAMERWQAVLRTVDHRGFPLQDDAVAFRSHTRGIDVTSPKDRTWLRRLIETHQPRLLCIGPLYRMTRAGSLLEEEASRQVQAYLDDLRSDYSLSIVTEAHAGNEQGGQVRSWRPIGSSVWRRWPEFGIGLEKDQQQTERSNRFVARVTRWRYDRVQREWPDNLERAVDPQMWWDEAAPL